MPAAGPRSQAASSRLETPSGDRGSSPSSPQKSSLSSPRSPLPLPPPPLHRGTATIADCTTTTTLPPTVTPATTTRQSVSLSTLWRTAPLPAIVAHPPEREAQEPPSDLTTSTGSVPSTTTTLTNTLPPTQSAALRALNAPAFQSQASSTANSKPAKSASTSTTISSQPVVVRTYSGPRHNSRPSSGLNSPRLPFTMNGPGSHRSALSQGLAARSERLPSVDDFSFSAILRAVDPEIRDAIDAIAEICARSRLSLADEYDAHLPPQGEITGTGPGSGWAVGMGALVGRGGRISRLGQAWSATDNPLTAVPEASSDSERLAGDSRGGSAAGGPKKRDRSAYGSLKSVISGGSGSKKPLSADALNNTSRPDLTHQSGIKPQAPGPAWAVNTSTAQSDRPSITLITSPQASKQLSLDLSSTITDVPETATSELEPSSEHRDPLRTHRRNTSTVSMPTTRTRSSTLSSIASWMPWSSRASSGLDAGMSDELTRAESRLREMLLVSQSSSLGKGKVAMSVT